MKHVALLALGVLLVVGCSTSIEYEEDWLDHPAITDPSVSDPSFRVSTRPGLTPADRSRPVVIAAHGFTASTYEWSEFRSYAETESDVLVSLVLLGGHGRSVEDDFEQSGWREWGQPILEEYQALVEQGYTDISVAGSSTGAALILEQLAAGGFRVRPPRHFFFIDPIVVPGDKMLTLIDVVAPVLGNVQNNEMTEEERRHWYTNRPAGTLKELQALCSRVRQRLADGFHLPAGSYAKVYKTERDETADPISALLIYNGLRDADGRRVAVEMIDSNLHVFTRLQGRSSVSQDDRRRQAAAFSEMVRLLRSHS